MSDSLSFVIGKFDMSEHRVHVAVDAMGGDHAPQEIVAGALDALAKYPDVCVTLVGQEDAITSCLDQKTYDTSRLFVKHASEIIETAEHPVAAIRRKKDSSMVVGLNMVKNKEADALVSAGNSGALLAGGTLLVGRIRGIERPPLAPLIPTKCGVSILVDCGANVDAKPSNLVQFARMGSLYMQHVMGMTSPRVAIVNIGAEEEKGNALVKETFPLLKACDDINFIGSIEAREIPNGAADVIVCDAFVGNVILKLYEGMAKTLVGVIKEGLMSTLISKIGAMLALPALKGTLKRFDASEYGGAPLLGINGLVVKTHGSAKAKEVCNTIGQCITFQKEDMRGVIERNVAQAAAALTPGAGINATSGDPS